MFCPFIISLYANIACVMSNNLFWHNTNEGITFKVEGPFKVKLGPTNASFNMARDVGITF
jgi:hypothetical protein